jgi:hypothetical protein
MTDQTKITSLKKAHGISLTLQVVGLLNALAAGLGVLLLMFGNSSEKEAASVLLPAGVSAMLICFTAAAIVQQLTNIAHLLRQLLRAYGHEPDC